MVGGIFATQVLWPYFIEGPLYDKYGSSQQPVYVTEKKEIYIQENIALVDAIEKTEKIVIGVKTKTSAGKIRTGAGLAVTSDGLVVTLAELVPQGSTFYFYVDGQPVSYQILKRDAVSGLVLVKLEKNNLSAAGFADMNKIKLGERVFLQGVVFASSTPENIVDEGIIKKIDTDYLKTNIIKTEGANGSILFNIEGNVVGLNKIDAEGNIITIPVSIIKQFVGF
jgi:S1-C subfamily serine protease